MDICQLNRGARWHTPHMLSCSLAQMIGSLEIYFIVFFHQGTCISDVHTGAYPISVLWSEMDGFSLMNDCDIFSSLALTTCVVMGF